MSNASQPPNDFANNHCNEPWPTPKQLPSALPEVMSYHSDLLPSASADAVDDIAERMQCPADFPAAAMLVAMAAVIGCRVGIRPRRFDDWLVVPNLWGCVVGRPSLKKSPAIAQAEKRVRAIEAREVERLADALQSAGIDGLLAEARIKAIKARIDKAMKSGEEAKARQLAQEITDIEAQVPPIPRRIITTDPTIEKLVDMLNVHRFGMLLWVDELVGWMRSLDRDDKAGVRQQYLTLWNGMGRLNIDRIGRGETVCDSPCVSLFGCATPGGLSDYVSAAQRGGRGDDGLVQRLQILVWPDAPRDFVHIDRWPNADAHSRLNDVFEGLADLDPQQFAELDRFDDGGGIPWVRFDADGQAIFDAWELGIQQRLRAGDLPEAFESHLSKYASMVPSIALVAHLASGGRGPVSGAAASTSVRWASYLESHAGRVYASSVAPERQIALPLLKRLIEWPKDRPIRVRSIRENGWANLTDSDSIERALELLADFGWVRSNEKKPKTGRPTVEYILHPSASKFLKVSKNRTPETIETAAEDTFVGFEGKLPGVFDKNPVPPARIQGLI